MDMFPSQILFCLCCLFNFREPLTVFQLLTGRKVKWRKQMEEKMWMKDCYFMGQAKSMLMPSVSRTLTGGSVAFMVQPMAKVVSVIIPLHSIIVKMPKMSPLLSFIWSRSVSQPPTWTLEVLAGTGEGAWQLQCWGHPGDSYLRGVLHWTLASSGCLCEPPWWGQKPCFASTKRFLFSRACSWGQSELTAGLKDK